MAAEAAGYVYRCSPFEGATFAVHHAIGDSANDQNGYLFWMSITNLAKKARMTRQTASKAVATLLDQGFLEITKDRRSSKNGVPSEYRFLFPDVPDVFNQQKKAAEGTESNVTSGDVDLSPESSSPTSDVSPEVARPVASGDTNPSRTQVDNQPKCEPKGTLSPVSPSSSSPYTAEFEAFWKLYPVKKGKEKALRQWNLCLKERGATVEQLMTAESNFARAMKREKRQDPYIMQAARFLGRDQEWKDYLELKRDWKDPRDNVSTDRDEPGGIVDFRTVRTSREEWE